MEFDLQSFMREVSSALQQVTPHSTPPRKRRGAGGSESPQQQLIDNVGQGRMVPARKRRRVVLDLSSSGQTSVDGTQSPAWDEFINLDSGSEDNDHIPAFFHPSLDMTTAIVSSFPSIPQSLGTRSLEIQETVNSRSELAPTERLDLVPNFYAYSVKACLLPIRRVQRQLVTHYFSYIHPMFPVVDEYHFTKIHQKFIGHEELIDKADFMVYYAIMVAGFAHLSEEEIGKTPYRSVTEGQEAQVDQLRARYWSQQTTDPIILTQVCLILTLWSPGWVGFQNNSYWIDMAFKHASAARLWEMQSTSYLPASRSRVLWWCCVVRDRVLALGMRRPHRLHQTSIKDAFITENDFGPEARTPSYSDLRMKKVNMSAFMWLCKLSRIMEELAIIQRRNKFARDWDGDKLENIILALEELKRLHRELKAWLTDFEREMAEALSGADSKDTPIPVSTLRIVANSLRATLYQPYLDLPEDHPALVKSGIDPLKVIKEGARKVAKSVESVMAEKKSDAIPTWLVSWITLPVAVYHVNQRIRLNATPDSILMPFLAQLVRRTSGALMLLLTVRTATKDHIGEVAEGSSTTSGIRASHSGFSFVHSGLSQSDIPRSREARLLACVTKAIDSALEFNGSSQQAVLNNA